MWGLRRNRASRLERVFRYSPCACPIRPKKESVDVRDFSQGFSHCRWRRFNGSVWTVIVLLGINVDNNGCPSSSFSIAPITAFFLPEGSWTNFAPICMEVIEACAMAGDIVSSG